MYPALQQTTGEKCGLVPKQAHNQWTNGRFTAVKLEA